MKQDSGLEADDSSESHDVIGDMTHVPYSKSDRSCMYRVESSPRDKYAKTDLKWQHTNLDLVDSCSRQSLASSKSFMGEFSDIKNCVSSDNPEVTPPELDGNRKRSFSLDIDRRFSEMEWLCDSRYAQEIAGSIAQSYGIEDDSEFVSYINAQLPPESYANRQRARRFSDCSSFSIPVLNDIHSRRVGVADDVQDHVPPASRDSATPNSLQHAEILRYCTYRHEGFKKRFDTDRVNKDLLPEAKLKPHTRRLSRSKSHSDKREVGSQTAQSLSAVSDAKHKQTINGDCKDSFV